MRKGENGRTSPIFRNEPSHENNIETHAHDYNSQHGKKYKTLLLVRFLVKKNENQLNQIINR